MAKATYKDAGVNLELYQESMSRLTSLLRGTYSPRVMPLDGGFAGLFQLDFESPLFRRAYSNPVLVACTDGVGTKLKVATTVDKHDTVGIDLVAMSVNDAICCGAEPLMFLDYVAMSADNPELLEQIVTGISRGCRIADCALLGGETAIMPDMYSTGDYDLAGFCVGVVEKGQLIDGHSITPGDRLLGIAASGLHSNGYSLVRKVVFEIAGLTPDDDTGFGSVADVLLEPTRIYARPIRQLLQHYKRKTVIHGIAHITGGGLQENLQRILPAGVEAQIERGSWDVPPVFPWLQELGEIDDEEMDRVFNMGVGLVLVVSDYFANKICRMLSAMEYETWEIGRIVEGSGEVVFNNDLR
ncbi:MAG: phosphoribosylformylglycinamidine cyclo-ligase [Pirellulaceae bacterium]|nr:phosphoribosylformylglycinamidine cyclo-ligase [Pirellulaceae bacterium]